jgi:hypothetical protein
LISVIGNNEIISIGDFNTEYNIRQEKFEDKIGEKQSDR